MIMTGLDDFTRDQIAGQRLMVGFDGVSLNDDLKYDIDALKIGGVILFKRNIISAEQTERLCRQIREYAEQAGQPPPLIAMDQEGGPVARLPEPFTRFPGNPHIKTPDDAIHFAKTTAADLRAVGVNMNMAPVMDTAPTDVDSIMRERVFSHDPAVVSGLGVTVIETFQQNGILSVAKHFPGIGRTTLDSHLDRPVFDAGMEDMAAFDLIPFQAAIDANVPGMMLSHILYTGLDKSWPASISPAIAHDLLRKRMGYTGVVMTDDLDMGAIDKYYDIDTVIDQILLAGIDIVLICHKGPNIDTAFHRIRLALEEDEGILEKGLASFGRIMALKKDWVMGNG